MDGGVLVVSPLVVSPLEVSTIRAHFFISVCSYIIICSNRIRIVITNTLPISTVTSG